MPKRPASCLVEERVFRTNLRQCSCGGSISKAHEVDATLYNMTGYEIVKVHTYRCTRYGCRRTFGPNFLWDGSDKVNTVGPKDLKNLEALFVNTKVGFALPFLQYHSRMEFRAFLSSRAIEDVYRHTFGVKHDGDANNRWRLAYSSAIMYYITIQELAPLDLHLKVGNEVTPEILAKYEQHVLQNVLPTKQKASVSEVVCDGHAKVHIKCSSPHSHAGQPRKDGTPKPYGHGRFKRILRAKPTQKPEGNDILDEAISAVMPLYKNMNCAVVDRACCFLPRAVKSKRFKQVKHWIVDKFHAYSCVRNPLHRPSLARRIRNTNTSAAEQVFSWFRGFARILHEATPERHAFKVLYYCTLHNRAVEQRRTGYLNQYVKRRKKKQSKPYSCGEVRKKPACKKPASAIVRR